ncbi:MAG: hypothetical protein PHH14_01385 [Candidatus Margulisbacteria bacterium]|nr:hypothetical protein [Candidatus Margulisiibacteriota bacterium]
MNKKLIVYPFLFAMYPSLFLYANNFREVDLTALFLPIVFSLLGTLLIWWLLYIINHDFEKSAFITTLIIVFFFSYGHFSSLIMGLKLGEFVLLRNRYRAVIYLVFFLFACFWAVCKFDKIRRFKEWLNLAAFIIIMFLLINLIGQKLARVKIDESRQSSGGAKIIATANQPDIYYLILDGYARRDVQQEIFGVAYDALFSYLRNKKFYLATQSTSNYAMTSLSLTSSLNMKYFLSSEEFMQRNTQENEVENQLRRHGYKIYGLEAGVMTEKNVKSSKRGISNSSFWLMIINTTMVEMVAHRLNLYAPVIRAEVLGAYNQLEKVVPKTGPKFVFVRIPSPHPPYIFNRHGAAVNTVKFKACGDVWKTSWDDKTAYYEQLNFISDRTIQSLNYILSNSKRQPIIIVQSDHGPQFSDEKNGFYRKRMGILNAYYLPPGIKKRLYQTITPVNSFRLVLSEIIGLKYPLLPDYNYFSTMERPYDFHRIKDINQSGRIE